MEKMLIRFNIPYQKTIESDDSITLTLEREKEFFFFYYDESEMLHSTEWDYQYSME